MIQRFVQYLLSFACVKELVLQELAVNRAELCNCKGFDLMEQLYQLQDLQKKIETTTLELMNVFNNTNDLVEDEQKLDVEFDLDLVKDVQMDDIDVDEEEMAQDLIPEEHEEETPEDIQPEPKKVKKTQKSNQKETKVEETTVETKESPKKDQADQEVESTANQTSVAMENPFSLCSFNTCTKTMNLFSKGTNYHLLKSVHPPTIPQNKCRRAFLVTSMPYSGAELQMVMMEQLIIQLGLDFRSHIYWNFHAHADLNGGESKSWIREFNVFLETLKPEEHLVIRTPYKDDVGAGEICASTIKINSMRSLVDVALLRYYRYEAYGGDGLELAELDARGIIEYVRTILLHQRYWIKHSQVVVDFDTSEEGLKELLKKTCVEYLNAQDHGICGDDLLLETVIKSDGVAAAINETKEQERFLHNIYNNSIDRFGEQIQGDVKRVFRSWIETH